MVADVFIFKNNQFTLFPCFTFIPKTGVGIPETGINFYRCMLILVENVILKLNIFLKQRSCGA